MLLGGRDVVIKYLKTEIVRHIAFSEDGKVRASENVLQETVKLSSGKNLVGIESAEVKLDVHLCLIIMQ